MEAPQALMAAPVPPPPAETPLLARRMYHGSAVLAVEAPRHLMEIRITVMILISDEDRTSLRKERIRICRKEGLRARITNGTLVDIKRSPRVVTLGSSQWQDSRSIYIAAIFSLSNAIGAAQHLLMSLLSGNTNAIHMVAKSRSRSR